MRAVLTYMKVWDVLVPTWQVTYSWFNSLEKRIQTPSCLIPRCLLIPTNLASNRHGHIMEGKNMYLKGYYTHLTEE